MLETTRLIKQSMIDDEFSLVIIYGPLRYGKSSLACQILAELYETWDPEILKRYIGFHPKDVLEKWTKFKKKQLAFLWDDAGLWLHALDWNSEFVKAVGKYLNVAGTDWGGLILTTPLPTWISKKIRGLPQAITIRIRKMSASSPKWRNMREGVAYRFWKAPDLKHTGVKKIYKEVYSRMLPDHFYNWYKTYRDHFTRMAKVMMIHNLNSLPKEIRDYEDPIISGLQT